MIPRATVEIDSSVPASATFWTPSAEDLDSDEGFGYFRDVWLIFDVPDDEAEAMVQQEVQLVGIVDDLARDSVEFDQIARALEHGDRAELPARLASLHLIPEVEAILDNEEASALGGLELGVAGLVYALASVGCFPAASCRSHPTNSWSHVPVVLFAARRPETEVVARLASDAHCGLDIDPARPELISIYAGSIENLMALARLIVRKRTLFGEGAPREP